MQKRWLSLVLLAQVGACFGLATEEQDFVDLLVAAKKVDDIFSKVVKGPNGEVFSINAKEPLREMAKNATDKLLGLMDAAKGERLPAALDKLKKDGVLSNWNKAAGAGWVADDKKGRGPIGDIMTIYSGNAKSVLVNKILRLIADDYLVLKELAVKIDELLSDGTFGTSADRVTKSSVGVAIYNFREWCNKSKGLAAAALKSLANHELFALWEMATGKTGWLDVERKDWDTWNKKAENKKAYEAVKAAIGRMMSMHGENNKKLVEDRVDAIFTQVRDILAMYVKIEIIDNQMRELDQKSDADANKKLDELAGILALAKAADAALGKISMNASDKAKLLADDAVSAFKWACEKSFVEGIDKLANNPIVTNWAVVKVLEGGIDLLTKKKLLWFDMNGAEKTAFENWKFEDEKHTKLSEGYKQFGKLATFMESKSKNGLQAAVQSIMAKAKGSDNLKAIEKLNKDKIALREKIYQLTDKLSKQTVPVFKLPKIDESLLPESGYGGSFGQIDGGEYGTPFGKQLEVVDKFADALRQMVEVKEL